MKIIPAIDILRGKVVRLRRGDFHTATEYSHNPLDIAYHLLQLGFDHLHIIDLDGAREGFCCHNNIITDLIKTGATLQVGGGIRSLKSAQNYLFSGVSKIIVGTAALEDPSYYHNLRTHFGDKVLLSLDVIENKLAIRGWQKIMDRTIQDVLDEYAPSSVIVTDISRDGTLSGVNVHMYRNIRRSHPHINLIAAGGIASVDTIKKLEDAGLSGVIIGKALYEETKFCRDVVGHYRSNQLG